VHVGNTDDTKPLISGVTGAILGISNLDLHLGFWRDQLGYEVMEQGEIPSETAKAIYDVDGSIDVWKLAPAQAPSGQVWLYRTKDSANLTARHPHTSEIGLHALDLYTRDSLKTYEQLSNAGWTWAGIPEMYEVPLGDKTVGITEGFCFGPEGTDVVFVEAKNVRPTIAWEKDPSLPYSELTSVVTGVRDVAGAKDFYHSLGMAPWYDVTFSAPGLEKMAKLPAHTNVQLVFMAGELTARIEIISTTNISNRVDITATQRVGRGLGHVAWTFRTTDLDQALAGVAKNGGRIISEVLETNDPVHGRANLAAVLTPENSFIELWESRS
jgi:catechol 2,3-dioxygenase-like lactoylglutathione lyase family enzyme